ncbi:MAG: nucleotide exchange factor GrpE [Verrucomicrobia bacterium]|nr:nucleotide exchange factor GrpE [Verrucomicrobiota bacterium]
MSNDKGNQAVDENAPAPVDAKSENAKNEPKAPSMDSITHEQFAALQDKAAKADEHWARLLREAADFENFKKRATRERQEAIKFANEGLLLKLVPIVDNFEMALTAANTPSTDPSVESLKKGVQMVHSLLKSTLAESGLEEIDALNQPFDPNFHEAVSQQETADVPEGHVVQQLRKGYKFRERLLRPATVVVAKKP